MKRKMKKHAADWRQTENPLPTSLHRGEAPTTCLRMDSPFPLGGGLGWGFSARGRGLRAALIWLMVVALSLSWLPAYAAPSPQAVPGAETAPVGCETVAPEALRDEMNRVSQAIFSGEGGAVDIAGIVARQWRLVGMDAAIDTAVRDAVVQVQNDTDLWSRFVSGWSPAQAEELTRQVADLAFTSTTFRTAVDTLSAAVGADLAATVAALAAQSATQATLCLQSYVGTRYSEALVAIFTAELQAQTDALDLAGSTGTDQGIWTVVDRHKGALGGVGVIIATQIAKRVMVRLGENIAKRVAGRVVGRIIGKAGSTLVPVAGWAIGAALIAYDLYTSRDGALPQIESGLQAAEVKATIRIEITDAVETELRLETPQLARDIANDLYAAWLDFQRKYTQVLSWAENDPAFAGLLAQTDDPAKLASLVDITLASLGQAGLDAALADGSLGRALDLPETSYVILAGAASFATLLAWADVAGAVLDQVVATEIYKHKAPGDLSRDELLALLAVEDRAAVSNLALIPRDSLVALLGLATDHLRKVGQTLSADDLTWLAGYLTQLSQEQANQLVALILDDPSLMAPLKDAAVQAQVVQAQHVGETLRFLTAPLTLMGYGEDLLMLGSARIGLGLFHAKYGLLVTLLSVGLPLLLALALISSLLRWLFGPVVGLLRALGWLARRPQSSGR